MTRPIRRLFVANRGEIARRVIKTAHAMGISTAVAYGEGDATAPFVAEAGSAVPLAGRSAAKTYLDGAALLEAARRTGCDAVHPGYGFLSENAGFARAVSDAGLVFVGPPAAAIEALGDKVRARKEAAASGVAVLEASESARAVPVMVKAAAGGGGKGMRIVRRPEDLEEALAAAGREAKAAFGDERVFLEPYLEGARHVEIQILGDSAGNLVHCFERECSIQRRHQKLVEESPSPALSPELRSEMGEAALSVARSFGYENAGTVEFLLGEDGRYYFLEVNTRLQVEHPVTEAVTGLDLVREQLLVAEGAPLAFGQDDLSLSGHAIEARLYAEDVAAGYLPSAGTLELFDPAELPGVRYDSGVEEGTTVGVEFDPLLAKVIAHAPTRSEAAGRLAVALARTAAGGVTTNREHLVNILRDEAFLAGETTTTFLEQRRVPAHLPLSAHLPGRCDLIRLGATAAALAAEAAGRAGVPVLGSLPSGFRTSVMPPERRRYRAGGEEWSVSYRRRRDGAFEVAVGPASEGSETSHLARRVGRGDLLEVDGLLEAMRVDRRPRQTYVLFENGAALELEELPRFVEAEAAVLEGALVAPLPGTVLALHARPGQRVEAGELLVVVEAMKMEHRVTAPFAGEVREVHAVEGSQVASGDLLVALDPQATEGA